MRRIEIFSAIEPQNKKPESILNMLTGGSMTKKVLLTAALIGATSAALVAAPRKNQNTLLENGYNRNQSVTTSAASGRGNHSSTDSRDSMNQADSRNYSANRSSEKTPQYRNQIDGEEICLEDLPLQELSAAEIEGLLLMREEEKLAMDLYNALAEIWDTPIFANIAASEAKHTEEVAELLERYNLTDPVNSNSVPGIYSNPELTELYKNLVARGSESWKAAMETGAAIEQLDIDDLKMLLAETDNEDITHVYTNLLAGSERHLKAFTENKGQGRRRI